MTYNVYHTDPTIPAYTVYDHTTNTDTSLAFPGKYSADYGKTVAENFLHLLENFASDSEPSGAIVGQLWYDTASGFLKVQNDSRSWKAASGIEYSATDPGPADAPGQLWVDTANRQLNIYTGTSWMVVGPAVSSRDGLRNGVMVEDIMDQSDALRSVVIVYISDVPVVVISKYTFKPKSPIIGRDTINAGVNLSNDKIAFSSGLPTFTGTATAATKLYVGSDAVESSKFLRSDTLNNTEYALNVKHNDGVAIGTDRNLIISYSENLNVARLYNSSAGSIELQTQVSGSPKTILKVSGSRVGINTSKVPEATLDVAGDSIIQGKLRLDGDNLGFALEVNGVSDIRGKITNGAILNHDEVSTIDPATDFVAVYSDSSKTSTNNPDDYLRKTKVSTLLASIQALDIYTLPPATVNKLGGVKVDGSTITINNNGVISSNSGYLLPASTPNKLGGVVIPAVETSGITNDAGTIGLATASTTQLGGVKVDGYTINITNGVIRRTPTARTVKSGTTTSIAVNDSALLKISGYPGYVLYKVKTTSTAGGARVRIYPDEASRNLNKNVIADVTTTDNAPFMITPGIIGFNNDEPPSTDIYVSVTNTNATAATFTVELTIVPIEG